MHNCFKDGYAHFNVRASVSDDALFCLWDNPSAHMIPFDKEGVMPRVKVRSLSHMTVYLRANTTLIIQRGDHEIIHPFKQPTISPYYSYNMGSGSK